jgi:hypothetical protein
VSAGVRACVTTALVRGRVRARMCAYLDDHLIPALLRDAHRRRELQDGRACKGDRQQKVRKTAREGHWPVGCVVHEPSRRPKPLAPGLSSLMAANT